jgi:hypothetical protein
MLDKKQLHCLPSKNVCGEWTHEEGDLEERKMLLAQNESEGHFGIKDQFGCNFDQLIYLS